jgi:Cu(I)/Ag(I) efflux system membrane protein CusA/SilA
MLERLIAGSVENRRIVLVLTAVLAVAGAWAVARTPVDAVPDLSDVQVIVMTEMRGQAPQIVEDQVTYPVSTAMLSVPEATTVRGISQFGLSFVYVIFEDGTDLYWARSRVLEALNSIQGELPASARPRLGPDATGVGWVFQYYLEGDGHDLAELRSIQDWYLRYELEAVPGVSEVAALGGFEKQYQVLVDPERLRGHGVTLSDVLRAAASSSDERGGRVLEMGGAEYMVRGHGYVDDPSDLAEAVVGTDGRGIPVRIRDVGRVRVGPEIRRGIADLNGEKEVVSGIVVMRFGENPLAVIDRVKQRLEEAAAGLPPGVEVKTAYDRSGLIHRAIEMLQEKLLEESLIVALVTALFLFHLRSALVAILTIPLGLAMAFLVMRWLGITANIMSLSGIAIAIGAMVDAAIVMIENMHRHLEREENHGRSRWEVAVESAREVGPALFFSLLVITLSFLPVFALQAQEGRLFHPLAFTKTFAMAAAALLSVTVVPVLMGLFVRGRIPEEDRNPLNRWMKAAYMPVLRWTLRRRGWVLAGAAGLLALTVLPASRIGSEFMPPLNEGSVMDMPSLLPGMGTGLAKRVLQNRDSIMASIPEVELVIGKVGRARTATDAAPMSMYESIATLKPREAWREGMTYEEIVAEFDRKVRTPGVANMWSMPIKNRLDMLATGIKTPVGIKVFGPDLRTIEEIGARIEGLLPAVPGAASVFAERTMGGRYLEVVPDRAAAARYGLGMEEVQRLAMAAVGGMNVATSIEGRERYTIHVRYAPELRSDPGSIRSVLLPVDRGGSGAMAASMAAGGGEMSAGGGPGAGGAAVQVPLGDLAEVRFAEGPPMIKSENGRLHGIVYVDVRGRDIGSFVDEARALLDRELTLPAGYRLAWSGQYEYMQRVRERLNVVVPVTLLIIFFLLYLNFRSATESLIVMLSLPFAAVGGVWLLWILGYEMSVAVAVGFIALAGVAAEIGVVMLVYLDHAYDTLRSSGHRIDATSVRAAVETGAGLRLRPVMMTVAAITLGLVPIMWGHGTGSEIMQRIAAPMIGGMVSATVLALLVVPAVYSLWRERQARRTTDAAEASGS